MSALEAFARLAKEVSANEIRLHVGSVLEVVVVERAELWSVQKERYVLGNGYQVRIEVATSAWNPGHTPMSPSLTLSSGCRAGLIQQRASAATHHEQKS